MSARAELLRLGLRWLMKRRGPQRTVAEARRRIASAATLVPYPPKGVVTTPVTAAGVNGDLVTSTVSRPDRHVLYLHGGGYVTGSPALYRHFTWRVASATRARVLSLDYRLAPEHPFPAALEDAVAAYQWLLATGMSPHRIAVIGDSAGGGLALAMLLKLRDDRQPLPAAAVVLSPWTDLAMTGASLSLNARSDPMFNVEDPQCFATQYLAGADPHNPYASPLYGDPTGLPPTLIHVGSDEILYDDALRMAERMRGAGCDVTFEAWSRMPHVWHLFAPLLPEARHAIARIGAFVERRM